MSGRIRSIKPEFFFDTELSELSDTARIAFIGLWCHADREGRLPDNPAKLKALIFPYKKVDMESLLKSLAKKPFIYRYIIDSKRYIQIVRWNEHQRCHHTELVSCIPPPNGEITVNSPLSNGEEPEGREGKGKEGKGDVTATPKVRHLEFVYLTDREYTSLCDNFGKGNTDSYIQRLNDYIGAKGKRYNSHYHVISGWYRRDHPIERPSGPAGRQL